VGCAYDAMLKRLVHWRCYPLPQPAVKARARSRARPASPLSLSRHPSGRGDADLK
jgi:hypothetical protein